MGELNSRNDNSKETKSTIKPILFHVMGRESCDDYLQDGLLCLKEE